MKLAKAIWFLFIVIISKNLSAEIIIKGSSEFKSKVNSHLAEAKNSSPYIYKIIDALETSSAKTTISPITDDKSTWHRSGKKSRSHTKPLDSRSRGAERNTPTNSIIYINVNRITRAHRTYKSGTLVHELVHAYDLAAGLYHNDYSIREKRAVFFQNIWRDKKGKSLRTNYHDRFDTLEYQNSKKQGVMERFVEYYFNHNNLE